jgi:Fe-S cluster assembly protein SufD
MTIQVSDAQFPSQVNDRMATTNGNDRFLSSILQARSEIDSQALGTELAAKITQLRHSASDRLKFLQVPTTKDEDWKYTDLSALIKLDLYSPQVRDDVDQIGKQIAQHVLPEAANSLLVFANGVFVPALSDTTALSNGVVFSSLGTLNDIVGVDAIFPYLDKYLGRHTDAQDTFASLNTACMTDAAIVFVPKGVSIETTIQIVSILTKQDTPVIAHPRCLVVAESDSKVTLVETFIGDDAATYWTNAVTEIWLGEHAQLNHTKVQWESKAAYHIATTAIAQMRGSCYINNAIALGAQLSRHNLNIRQVEEQTETHINGLALIGDRQLADTHSCMAHDRAHGASRQLHKCIIGDRAHAVFNGKIQVAKAAQLTDSAQLNRNLLLSAKAKIDTKPELEILADNVKCAHGATVSQLDAEEIFYLQSRCIDAASAANLLTYAFAAEVIERIPVNSLREMLNSFVLAQTQATV